VDFPEEIRKESHQQKKIGFESLQSDNVSVANENQEKINIWKLFKEIVAIHNSAVYCKPMICPCTESFAAADPKY